MGTRRRIGEWRKERWLQMKQEHRDKQMNMGTWRRIREWRKERRQQRKQAQGEKTTDERIGERARQSWSHQTRHITRITCPSLVEHRFGRVLLLRHGHGTGWAYKADWTKVATRKEKFTTWWTHTPTHALHMKDTRPRKKQESGTRKQGLNPMPLSSLTLLVVGCWIAGWWLLDVGWRVSDNTWYNTHDTQHAAHNTRQTGVSNRQPSTNNDNDKRWKRRDERDESEEETDEKNEREADRWKNERGKEKGKVKRERWNSNEEREQRREVGQTKEKDNEN